MRPISFNSLYKKTSKAFCNCCLAITLFSLGLSSTPHAQQAISLAEKASGPKVELSLIVADNREKSLNTVSKGEVRLIEDGVEQTVLSVERDDRLIDYGLVIDSSGSLIKLMVSTLEAARSIIANRRPADQIFIERFISSDKIDKIHDFSSDSNALIESLNLIKIESGQSAVIDALYVAANHLAKHNRTNDIRRRKALVIITDGEDSNSSYTVNQLVKLLRQERIQVFIIGLTIDLEREQSLSRRSSRESAETFLRTVAEESGGRVFFPTTKADLIDATAQIIGDLRAQFRITYQSSNNSAKKGFRKVKVKLISASGEKRIAIVPRGYYVGSEDVQAKPKDQK